MDGEAPLANKTCPKPNEASWVIGKAYRPCSGCELGLTPQRGLSATDPNQNPRLATSGLIGKSGKGLGEANCRKCQTLTATPAQPGDLLTELDGVERVSDALSGPVSLLGYPIRSH